jgi:chromosome segregation ATPase
MVLVRITDSAWLEGAPVQNEQHEAMKAQLLHSQQRAQELEGELASLRAEYQAACSAQSELVKERGQLEKRVSAG